MIRKTLTIFSLIGLLLSMGHWGVMSPNWRTTPIPATRAQAEQALGSGADGRLYQLIETGVDCGFEFRPFILQIVKHTI